MEIQFAGGCTVEAPEGSRIQPATSKFAIPTHYPKTGAGFKHLYELISPDGSVRIIHVTHDEPNVGWHFCEKPEECHQP